MRRLSANKVLQLSIIAALLCLVIGVWVFVATRSWWTVLPLALAFWFALDAGRARGWQDPENPDSPRSG
ncbi:hypothetical protein [Deinococcus peraridilitoris]|nr:hypothetical protein [Deinococcus peraridilitoris]